MNNALLFDDLSHNMLNNPFRSFWMAGFECTDKQNAFGNRVDFLTLTGHLQLLSEDYLQLLPFHIRTVREGIRWSQVEKNAYEYDWSTVDYMMERARLHGIQIVWDLCHFGFPDDLTPLHPMFARRFAALCRAFVQFYRSKDPYGELIVTPINEVSFLSWLGGDVRGTSPYCIGQGWEVKYHLMKAYIEGVAVLRGIDPSIRILTTEPLVNIVPPLAATPDQAEAAAKANEHQFQAMDILCGRICPELGGSPDYLDIMGVNYYYNNQCINGTSAFLPWVNEENDPRFIPLNQLIKTVFERYRRPVVLAETSHSGEHRPDWIESIATETAIVLKTGIPFWGVCLYPIIDRPDWDHMMPWHGSGLWDAEIQTKGLPKRVLHEPSAIALQKAQAALSAVMHKKTILSLPVN